MNNRPERAAPVARASLLSALWFLCSVALGILSATPSARAQYAPSHPAQANLVGISQKEWAARWMRWALTIPIATHPIAQIDGSFAEKGADTGSDHVFFLGGIFFGFGPDTITRDITIPAGTHLFFPLVNSNADNTAPLGLPPTNFTPYELLTSYPGYSIIEMYDNVDYLFCTVDGKPIRNPYAGRQLWDEGFIVRYFDNDNINGFFNYDTSLNTGVFPSDVVTVQDGYYVALPPLSVGKHVLKFGGSITARDPVTGLPLFTAKQDITYNITVVPKKK
ncbi:MAG TPA: hypothetical protein VM490_22845 [Armatimonadaceae bacterium]|nr:hypothetical protein [Armatimonadaceae bacterium]